MLWLLEPPGGPLEPGGTTVWETGVTATMAMIVSKEAKANNAHKSAKPTFFNPSPDANL